MTREEMEFLIYATKKSLHGVDTALSQAKFDHEEELAEHLDGVRKTLNQAIAGLQAASKYVKG